MQRSRFNLSISHLVAVGLMLLLGSAMAVSASAQSGGLKGRVRNTSGRGIPSATVTARQNGADVRSATADGKGDFLLSGLENGVYNLVFEANGYSSGVLYNVEVKKNRVADLGESLILSPDQGSLVIVKGSVFYREGTSVPAATVDIEKVNSDGSVTKLGSTTTNLSGEFTFKRPQGNAKLRITARYNKAAASKEVEVSEPAIYRLAITLDVSRSDK